MIHTLRGTPASSTRRIAVVKMPHGANNRLGRLTSIRDATPYVSLVTMTTEPPSNAERWLAQKIAQQSAAVANTPGTLIHNAVPTTQEPPVARWNSWNGPCGAPPPGSSPTADSASTSTSPTAHTWLMLAAGIGALASALYLAKGGR
jgi:hypothetical protein